MNSGIWLETKAQPFWPHACNDTSVGDGVSGPKGAFKSMNKTLGIILIVVGLIGLAWGGFSFTTREKVADIGPIHASRDKTHSVPLPPIAGALALVGGVALLVTGKNS